MTTRKYPPRTESLDELARFFDRFDTTELEGLEEIADVPRRSLVSVNLKLPREDLEVLRRTAAREGLSAGALMRRLLHRFAARLASNK